MATAERYRALAWRIATEEFGETPLRDTLYRMLRQESGDFDPDVVEGRRRSSAGAIGIAQFMAQTAANLGVDPLNPEQAVRGAARYLKENMQMFGGDVAKGVAAYNAGPGNVQKAVQAGGANWTNFLPGETKSYLQITQPQGAAAPNAPAGDAALTTQDPAKAVFAAVNALGQREIGKRYAGPVINEADAMRWGNPGWDCSSFVSGVYRQLGVTLTPYTDSAGSDAESRLLNPNEARPGDIVFYRGAGSGGNPAQVYHHMGIYLGDGKMIDASITPGADGVAIRDVDVSKADFRRPKAIDSPEGLQQVAQKAVQVGGSVSGQDVNQMVQTGTRTPNPATQSGSFFTSQIEDAKRQIDWAQNRKAEIQAGKSGQDARADQLELEHLDTRIADEMSRLDAMQTALKNEQDLNPAAEGRDPVATAGAIAGIRANADEHNRWLFDTFVGLMDKNFANQLGVANLLTSIFNINEQNAQAKVDSEIARGTLLQSGREAAIQAYAMQQTAEAARASEVLARAGKINEADWMIAERSLPPGTHYVPGLEPDGALMTAVRNLGLPGVGLRATPTDWNKLDFRTSLADAETTVPAVPQFPIAALESQVAANEKIQPYQPGTLTRETAGVPNAPDLTSDDVKSRIPTASQAGAITDEDLIDIVLGRGKYAPAPPQQSAAPITQTTGSSQPAMRDFPVVPGTTTTTVPRHDTTMRDFPVVPGTTTLKTDASTPPAEEDDDEDLLALLKKFGIGVAGTVLGAGSPSRVPGAIVKRGWEFIR